MVDKKSNLYKFRYEVASERKLVLGTNLIPEADPTAAKNHISDDEKFKMIQRYAFDGNIEAVKGMLSEFPVFKREDLKEMLKRSAFSRGKSLEF
tara:strand:- start:350 stop:631 length:282 start_codon:yes stop_codon:yes gene_type:complete